MFIRKSCMFICKNFIFYSKIYAFIRKGFVLICEIIIFLPINMSSKGFCTLCIYLFVYFPYLHVLIEIVGCCFFYFYMYVSYLTMCILIYRTYRYLLTLVCFSVMQMLIFGYCRS